MTAATAAMADLLRHVPPAQAQRLADDLRAFRWERDGWLTAPALIALYAVIDALQQRADEGDR